MKKHTNWLVLALAVLLACALLAGCGGAASSTASAKEPAAGASTASGTAPAPAGESHKVALILSGPVSDMSWNATAYNGLLEIEKLGAEVSYQENVDNSSLADAINTYATGGLRGQPAGGIRGRGRQGGL